MDINTWCHFHSCFHSYLFFLFLELSPWLYKCWPRVHQLIPSDVFVCLMTLRPYPEPCKLECVLYRWLPALWWDSWVNVHMYELSFLTGSLWAILWWRWSSLSSPSGLTVSTGEAMTMGWGGSSDADVLASQVWLQYPAAHEWAGCDSMIVMLVLGRAGA